MSIPTPIIRLVIACIVFYAFFALTQDIQLFPGAIAGLFQDATRDPNTLPANVDSEFVMTEDNKRIETWRLPATTSSDNPCSKFVAIVFHGNGTSMEGFFIFQQFFKELGITSYQFDFRGYGKSEGWPSERGLELDAEATWKYVLENENITADQIILFGFSIGSGPAAYLAQKFQPHSLVMLAPFTSITDMARKHLFYRIFLPVIWYKMPVAEHVSKLTHTKLLISHGKHDNIIPPEQSKGVLEAYNGQTKPITIWPNSGHNDLFIVVANELGREIRNLCRGK